MRKVGGVLLIILGVVLILISTLRAISVLLVLLGGDATAYGMGALAGAAVIVILFVALGLKSIKKGRSLCASEVKPPAAA